jgi:hypothetical protein
MKKLLTIICILACAAPLSAQAFKSDIAPVKARADIIASAEAILTRRTSLSDELPANIKNPFNPQADDSDKNTQVKVSRSGRELIAVLAAQLMPTGSAELAGERFLLLGQRKVKVGDHVPILFENVQYDVEIAAIESGTFTIRCRNEEFTRPIKPGKNQ